MTEWNDEVIQPTPINSKQHPNSLDMPHVYKKAMAELARPYPSIKLPDWTGFNSVVGGFREKEFSILCGGTGVGKTTFLANVSAQLLRAGVRHYVASVETGHTDYMKRVISALAHEDLNTGDSVAPVRLHEINDKYGSLFLQKDLIQFALYDNRVSIKELLADTKHMVEKKGCRIAMYDNLNFFMEVTKSSDSVVEMDRVIHDSIIFAKTTPVHSIMVMHPKKTENGRVENEFEIKGSSTAVQEAHNIFLLNRPTADAIKDRTSHPLDRELKICKMRRRGRWAGYTLTFKCQGSTYFEGLQAQ